MLNELRYWHGKDAQTYLLIGTAVYSGACGGREGGGGVGRGAASADKNIRLRDAAESKAVACQGEDAELAAEKGCRQVRRVGVKAGGQGRFA